MKQRNAFGDLLRYWRKARKKSQLDLAIRSGYSQRRVSFLESGRASPGREAVIVPAETLDVPIKARSKLLEAAGFASEYTHEPLSSEHLKYAVRAVQDVLSCHRPFPEIVVDRAWNSFGANEPALALFQRFIHSPEAYDSLASTNAIRICLDEKGVRLFIRNWQVFIRGVLGELKHELERERDEARLELFTMMSAFNFPLDATTAELRIETFLPVNAASREFLIELDGELAPGSSFAVT